MSFLRNDGLSSGNTTENDVVPARRGSRFARARPSMAFRAKFARAARRLDAPSATDLSSMIQVRLVARVLEREHVLYPRALKKAIETYLSSS